MLEEQRDASEDLHQYLIRNKKRVCAGGRGRRQRGLTSIYNKKLNQEFVLGGRRRQRGLAYIFDKKIIRDVCSRRVETPERIYINIQEQLNKDCVLEGEGRRQRGFVSI